MKTQHHRAGLAGADRTKLQGQATPPAATQPESRIRVNFCDWTVILSGSSWTNSISASSVALRAFPLRAET